MTNNNEPIRSSGKATIWLWGFMALVFLGLPSPALLALPEELGKDNYAILGVLLFPAAGLWMGWMAVRALLDWRRFGPTPLWLDPHPGCAGGQVGGTIKLGVPATGEAFRITLQCVHVRVSGSGKNRSRSESVVWQHHQPPLVEADTGGARLRFLFDVPGELPASSGKSRNYHFWRVSLKGEPGGRKLKRHYEIPVVQGEARAANPLPESHLRETARREEIRLLEEAQSQVQVTPLPDGLELYSAAGRHKAMSAMLVLFGLAFAGAGVFLLYQAVDEGLMPGFMAVVFMLIGVPMAFGGIYMAGRALRVKLVNGHLESIRYFAGRPLFRRRATLTDSSRLELAGAGSMTQGDETVEFFHLVARVDGRKLRLAEGLAGRQLAEAFRDTVVRLAGLS